MTHAFPHRDGALPRRPGLTARPVVTALSAVCLAIAALPAQASSHREAPSITLAPKVDGTDFYMFNSYESGRGDYVTLIANYQPLQDAVRRARTTSRWTRTPCTRSMWTTTATRAKT